MKLRLTAIFLALSLVAMVFPCALLLVQRSYPRPYRDIVAKEELPLSLVYAVIRAESGFREDAKSRAGAVGLMQLKPATAEFICEKEGIDFFSDKLSSAEYNIRLGCGYLRYLFGKFKDERTALAAYNAGEGTVREWLTREEFSRDGVTLDVIPYEETRVYVKKVEKNKKIYEIIYR